MIENLSHVNEGDVLDDDILSVSDDFDSDDGEEDDFNGNMISSNENHQVLQGEQPVEIQLSDNNCFMQQEFSEGAVVHMEEITMEARHVNPIGHHVDRRNVENDGIMNNNVAGIEPEQQLPNREQQRQEQQQNNIPRGVSENRSDIENEPPLQGYERTELIGRGAYGTVYRGVQISTGNIVAIKSIPFVDSATPEGGVPCNVIREISLLKELDLRNHPHIVKLLDVIQAQPRGLYLVFEHIAYDLKTFMDKHQVSTDIQQRRGLPNTTVKNFMSQILSGVGFIHTYRVLHRDLKPHNLLISEDGTRLKLADFGLARLSGLPNGPYTYEVVTLWYRAPELLLGANRYSAAVDIWSIGCIFAEMITGLPLFPGRSDIDQIFKIFQRRGTPTAAVWPAYIRLPHYNRDFPQWPSHHVTELIPPETFGSLLAADLLEQFLQYDPDRRPICRMALNHRYFLE